MEAWYEIHPLRRLIGVITDFYVDYIELKDVRTGEYVLIHENKVKIIK